MILDILTNSTTIIILCGLLCYGAGWRYDKKFPDLKRTLVLFTGGGLFYGALSSLYFGITGKPFLTDSMTDYRIILSVGALAFFWLGVDLFRNKN